MNRLISLMLIIALLILLCACAGNTAEISYADKSDVESTVNADVAKAAVDVTANNFITLIPDYTAGAKSVTWYDDCDNIVMTFSLEYDSLDRLIKITATDSDGNTQTVENRYNDDGKQIGGIYSLLRDPIGITDYEDYAVYDMNFEYDETGRLVKISDARGEYTRLYGEDGRITEDVGDIVSLTYEYGEDFIIETCRTEKDGYGSSTIYSLDEKGRITNEKNIDAGNTMWYAVRTYDNNGHLTERAFYYSDNSVWGITEFEY